MHISRSIQIQFQKLSSRCVFFDCIECFKTMKHNSFILLTQQESVSSDPRYPSRTPQHCVAIDFQLFKTYFVWKCGIMHH